MNDEQREAGRVLDAEVAERVMGWRRIANRQYPLGGGGELVLEGYPPYGGAPGIDAIEVPLYSTTWEGAGLVIEKMRERGDILSLSNLKGAHPDWDFDTFIWQATFRHADAHGYAETAPHAICLAALRAVATSPETPLIPSDDLSEGV